jgi:hypothetical protein
MKRFEAFYAGFEKQAKDSWIARELPKSGFFEEGNSF